MADDPTLKRAAPAAPPDAEEIVLDRADLLRIEKERLELERYKAQLDYKKFVLGSVFVALAIAAIPPLFQLATAVLEYTKSNADRQAKQQAFRDDYIKDFVSNALDQDIELRIRFAQYFARVSTEPYRNDWIVYLEDLRKSRAEIRSQIDRMESEWRLKAASDKPDTAEIDRLERNLAWAYKEVGYVARNRSAATNPRAPDQMAVRAESPSSALLLGRFAEPVYYLVSPLRWAPSDSATKKFEPVAIPAGFVFTFDSIPRALWSSAGPDSNLSYAAVIHDYLYWTQSLSRAEADEIFRLTLQQLGANSREVASLSLAIKTFGQKAWDANAKLKSQGEKRVLRDLPTEPDARWSDWKTRSNVFAD